MSTSLLVTKMQEAAKEQGIDAEIFACPASEADDKMDQKELKPEAGLEPTAFGGLLKHLDASENQCAVGVLVWEFEVWEWS